MRNDENPDSFHKEQHFLVATQKSSFHAHLEAVLASRKVEPTQQKLSLTQGK